MGEELVCRRVAVPHIGRTSQDIGALLVPQDLY